MGKAEAQALLEQANAALAEGEREEAETLLKQALEEDAENIEAWVQLAEVVEDEDERRFTLSQILIFDPENEFARAQLEALESGGKSKTSGDDEIVPGITRRQARTTGIGLTVFTLVICAITFAITSSANSRRQAILNEVAQTQRAFAQATQTIEEGATALVETATQEEADRQGTATATVTPATSTPVTPDIPTLPPTFTPSPTATEATTRLLELPPDTISGQIIAWGGNNPRSAEFLNMLSIPLADDGAFSRINADSVQNVHADTNGRIVYNILQNDLLGIELININDPNVATSLDIYWGGRPIIEPRNPKLSWQSGRVVFSAIDGDTNRQQIYLINLDDNEVVQITNDEADYTSPAISPEGNRIAAVRDAGSGPDITLITVPNLEGPFTPIPLTNDGNARVESSLNFNPANGTRLVFSAHTSAEPDNHDIYVLPVQQGAASVPLVTTDANEIYPVFSPDGNYIAYSANPNALYNIFIYDINTRSTYQLTDETEGMFSGGWIN